LLFILNVCHWNGVLGFIVWVIPVPMVFMVGLNVVQLKGNEGIEIVFQWF